jgi:hypothetical protein
MVAGTLDSASLLRSATVVAALAVLALPSSAAPGTAATHPIMLTITDSSATIAPATVPVGPAVLRVRNRGSRPHAVSVAGHRTPTVAAGKTVELPLMLTKRRAYKYTILPGGATTGWLTVVDPCTNPTTSTVEVTLTTNSIDLSEPSFACGTVTFQVENTDPSSYHDFSLDLSLLGGAKREVFGPRLGPGGTATMKVTFPLKGNIYAFSRQPEDDENGFARYLVIH